MASRIDGGKRPSKVINDIKCRVHVARLQAWVYCRNAGCDDNIDNLVPPVAEAPHNPHQCLRARALSIGRDP